MDYSAKTLRDKAKSRARALAAPGDYAKDQMVSSSDWSPASPINADYKTGARPISPRNYKRGGAVKKATGGEIADAIVNRNVKKANAERPGAGKHVGGFMCGGKAKRATGGGVLDKKAVGDVEVTPKRAKAEHYAKGGKIKKAGGGGSWLEKMVGKPKSTSDLSGVGKGQTSSYSPSEKASMEEIVKGRSGSGLPETEEIMETVRRGHKAGGKANWIAGAIKNKGALHKQLGIAQDKKIPSKTLAKAADKPGKLGKRARLAETLRGFKRADGGRLPSPDEAIGTEVRMKGLKVMPSRDNSAAAQVTPSQLKREEGYTRADMMAKRPGRASGGSANANPLSTAAKAVGKATGGARKGKTDIKINIIAGGQKPAMPAAPINLPAPPMPPAPPVAAPPPAMMGAGPASGGMPMARRSGGRVSKFASSYKDMTAGAGSGEGRMQKTDIAKKDKGAPTKKRGGSIKK